jgi:hypothetical protein
MRQEGPLLAQLHPAVGVMASPDRNKVIVKP